MVQESSQMSDVGGVLVPMTTSCAAGERCGLAASVTAHNPISSVSGDERPESVLRTNAVDKGWENS